MSENECPTCGENFGSSRGMKVHHSKVHNERVDESDYTEDCPSCEKSFKTQRGLENHHAKVHNENIGGTEVCCENCGNTVRKKPSNIKNSKNNFCSRKCKSEYERVDRISKECYNCGEKFSTPPWEDADYCSQSCFGGTKWLNCEYCKKEYEVIESANSTFCSKKCQHNWQKENWTGENGPNWKGGWERYYGAGWQEFRRAQRERYNHTCQACGKKCEQKHHDAHHIKPIREFYNITDAHFGKNVTLLCKECHRKVETKMDRDTQFKILEGQPDSWDRVQEVMQDV